MKQYKALIQENGQMNWEKRKWFKVQAENIEQAKEFANKFCEKLGKNKQYHYTTLKVEEA